MNAVKESGIFNLGHNLVVTLSQIAVIAAIGLMTIMGGLIVIAAKIALGALIGIGPVFIFFFMFPVTTQFAVLWLSQVWNYVFQLFFITIFLSIALRVCNAYMDDFVVGEVDGETMNVFLGSIQFLFLGVVVFGLLKQTTGLASAIGGGVSLAPSSLREIAKNAAKPFTKTSRYLAESSYRNESDGRPLKASRLSHMMNGNSMLSSDYRNTNGHQRPEKRVNSVTKGKSYGSNRPIPNKFKVG